MSRIGKKPVAIESGVKVVPVQHGGGTRVAVEGPKGKLSFDFRPEVTIAVQDDQVVVSRNGESGFCRSYHGTVRSLLANMVHGVSKGFEKRLQVVGVGYNAKLQKKSLVLQIGYSHPVELEVPPELQVEVPNPTTVVVRGADKQAVGEFAARVRKVRPPEPYKGKGIRYEGETVARKAGKTFGSGE
jgi:large subunit ribosomal protein L6